MYPTIVNNVPKEKTVYSNSMDDFALLDNNLAASQLDIGESSNLAQIIQTYSKNYDDQELHDYISILAIAAQISIDSAKRRFDVNISSEIKRLKQLAKVKERGYPKFWLTIHRDFNEENINYDLKCPMNCLYDIKIPNSTRGESTIPFGYFYKKYTLDISRKTSKRVEDLITKYSLKVCKFNKEDDTDIKDDEFLLLRNDFEDLLNDIRAINISKNYLGLMSWLIDRCFVLNPKIKSNDYKMATSIKKAKMNLLKILYEVNSASLLKCLSNNC